jgi:mycothiol synthase
LIDRILNDLTIVPLSESNLNAVHAMCERNVLYYDYSLETFRRATLMDEGSTPELSMVAINKDENPIAFFFAVFRKPWVIKFRNKLVIKMFVVDSTRRCEGIGTMMMRELLKRAKQHEKASWRMKISVMDSNPHFLLPGLDPRHTEAFYFLKKNGFKRYRIQKHRINLKIRKEDFPNEEPAKEKNGYKISRASQEEKEETVGFVKKHFGLGTWPEETRISFENDPPTTFIARDPIKNEVIGFAAHSVLFPGSFGPTGVDKVLRGKGIGGLLLKWCLWDIKQMGLKKCIIMWVVGDTKYFYLKSANARIHHIYWPMKKRI